MFLSRLRALLLLRLYTFLMASSVVENIYVQFLCVYNICRCISTSESSIIVYDTYIYGSIIERATTIIFPLVEIAI